MAAPYLVIGSIGGSLFYLYRRAASKSETQKESSQPVAPWRGIRRKAEDE
jgi:hypothetical protein